RRTLLGALAGALLATPVATKAQQVKKTPRIAFIFANTPEAELARPNPASRPAQAFPEGIRQLGWIDGQNITIEGRAVAGRPERVSAAAQELVAPGADLIVLAGTTGVSKVRQVSQTIPIVVAGGALVEAGLAQSLAPPGGTVPGLKTFPSRELG